MRIIEVPYVDSGHAVNGERTFLVFGRVEPGSVFKFDGVGNFREVKSPFNYISR